MGCIFSKGTCAHNDHRENEKFRYINKPSSNKSVPLRRDDVLVNVVGVRSDGSTRRVYKAPAAPDNLYSNRVDDIKIERIESTRPYHQRRATMDNGARLAVSPLSRIVPMPNDAQGEQVVGGWPSWLSSVAGDAIRGLVPRRAESFEKLNKIGQGTYSSVYRARDLETSKIVAMKKVRFVNMDPESVRFMAREIFILRKLDHPNVMKLEGLVTSRMSCSLYLVFEYMEHDLAGLLASRSVKFTESQIKCYMQQLFRGLEHCHSQSILHRDIKGSNLLINNDGVLKIGDFGLATMIRHDQNRPLTSRVVTLWYRAPELLLGATQYGVSVDLWSAGCILAELFAGKPIMPGRTEVEQMHKIFKLCGSPSEEYWKKSKLPHATSFKPQHPYKRCLAETFKDFPPSALRLLDDLLAIEPESRESVALALENEFFKTKPLPCDPSSIPKYTPSKEFDARLRDEARRKKAETVRGCGSESVRRGSKMLKEIQSPEFNGQTQEAGNERVENGHVGLKMRLAKGGAATETERNGLSHATSMLHPMARPSSSSWTKNPIIMESYNAQSRPQKAHTPFRDTIKPPARDPGMGGYVKKRSRIQYSGPLMPPGGNVDDMLKEHERQIQEAVRKARYNKGRTNKDSSGCDEFGEFGLIHHYVGSVG